MKSNSKPLIHASELNWVLLAAAVEMLLASATATGWDGSSRPWQLLLRISKVAPSLCSLLAQHNHLDSALSQGNKIKKIVGLFPCGEKSRGNW